MSMRSSQSDFSKAVMRCFDVCSKLSRVSCVEEAERREAVDASINLAQGDHETRQIWNAPKSCVERTDFSSSPCIRPSVRCKASVTLLLAAISASSLHSEQVSYHIVLVKYRPGYIRHLFRQALLFPHG